MKSGNDESTSHLCHDHRRISRYPHDDEHMRAKGQRLGGTIAQIKASGNFVLFSKQSKLLAAVPKTHLEV